MAIRDDFSEADRKATGEFYCSACRVRRQLAEKRRIGRRIGCTTCLKRRAEAISLRGGKA